MAAISRHSFNIEPYGDNVYKSSVKLLGQLGQTLVEWLLGGPLSGLYLKTPPQRNRRYSYNMGPYRKNVLKSFPVKLLNQFGTNFDGMVLKWSPFRIVSDDLASQQPPSNQSIVLTWEAMGKCLKTFSSETA